MGGAGQGTSEGGGAVSEGGAAGGSEGGFAGEAGGEWISLTRGGQLGWGGEAEFDGPGFGPLCVDSMASLDLVITEHFIPVGFFDGSASEMQVELAPSIARAPGARGSALALHWLAPVGRWVGVAMLNGGWLGPGLCIEEGAAAVRFQARGEHGGEVVDFHVVDSSRGDLALMARVLTTNWQTFEIGLRGVDYNQVKPPGGVKEALVIGLPNAALGEQRVYVDDMVWVAESDARGRP